MTNVSGTYRYTPHGVCSRNMELVLQDGILEDLRIEGGCSGNLQGIAALVRGSRVEDVIRRLRGIRCESKPTSCPDQLATALLQALENLSKGGLSHG